jgi:hypothetical protein
MYGSGFKLHTTGNSPDKNANNLLNEKLIPKPPSIDNRHPKKCRPSSSKIDTNNNNNVTTSNPRPSSFCCDRDLKIMLLKIEDDRVDMRDTRIPNHIIKPPVARNKKKAFKRKSMEDYLAKWQSFD